MAAVSVRVCGVRAPVLTSFSRRMDLPMSSRSGGERASERIARGSSLGHRIFTLNIYKQIGSGSDTSELREYTLPTNTDRELVIA